ncbi:hypothetical protein ACFVG9_06895 [Saccharothrix carnea]|uniref:hypothetical protein n=1 Tax=Saccharothrix carnea TaxID=1280637 RepID=UPI00363DB219
MRGIAGVVAFRIRVPQAARERRNRPLRTPERIEASLSSTCPVRTDTRAIAVVRNRAMMPCVMSSATGIAVPWTVMVMVMVTSRMPGVT